MQGETSARRRLSGPLDGLKVLELAQITAGPVALEHPRARSTRALGLPIKLSATPGRVVRPAPLLGEHTREVLSEFGFSAAEIEALYDCGAAA